MLVLTRRPGRGDSSVIVIGEKISIEVIGIETGLVKLGILAPESTPIRVSTDTSKLTRKAPSNTGKP